MKINVHHCPITHNLPNKNYNFNIDNIHLSESRLVVSDSLWPHGLLQPMEFSRPEYWNGQPFPFPGNLPNPGIEPRSPILQTNSLPAEPQGKLDNIHQAGHFSENLFLTKTTFF